MDGCVLEGVLSLRLSECGPGVMGMGMVWGDADSDVVSSSTNLCVYLEIVGVV